MRILTFVDMYNCVARAIIFSIYCEETKTKQYSGNLYLKHFPTASLLNSVDNSVINKSKSRKEKTSRMLDVELGIYRKGGNKKKGRKVGR